ncbi:MAG: response regulator [Clostridia bacterium]|nr:response regulator [Clostridia bacterium]
MRAICVDDESLLTDYLVSMCRDLPPLTDAVGFTRAKDALHWLKENDADLALLDIDMPDMNGIVLAAEIKKLYPEMVIIFLTGFSEYAVDAFGLHVAGYLLKPITKDRLAKEIEYALSGKQKDPPAHIRVQTFGSFDLFVDGKMVTFKQAKCKELLAYLIDRQGGSVTRAEAFSILWEDRLYDRPMQKQFDVIIRSLRDTLEENGIGEILEIRKGALRVKPEEISCDAWRFFSGDINAINAYRGEYMSAYSWGSYTESFMNRKCGFNE